MQRGVLIGAVKRDRDRTATRLSGSAKIRDIQSGVLAICKQDEKLQIEICIVCAMIIGTYHDLLPSTLRTLIIKSLLIHMASACSGDLNHNTMQS